MFHSQALFEQKGQFQFEKQHEFNAKTKEKQDQLASAVETGFANMKEELAAHFKKADEANKDLFKNHLSNKQ